jgi:FKBP-type peptidyl-prolyl cis-trans isomerase
MKKFSVLSVKAAAIIILSAALFSTCKKDTAQEANAMDKDTSYAFGMAIASMIGLPSNLQLDYNAMMEGFSDFTEARETRLTPEQAQEKVSAAMTKIQSQMDETAWVEGEKSREEGDAFLAENGAKSGVTTTASGLQYEVIAEGSGNKPAATDTVQVQYEGTLINGTVFDSSYQRGAPAEFPLNGVIPGWTEGIQLMSEGSTYRFVIPSNLAYGPNSPSPAIPPNSTLIFKVELLSIIK